MTLLSENLVIVLASPFDEFFWERWNYGSAHSHLNAATNLNYWVYRIPFVDTIHAYSEMPILGYAHRVIHISVRQAPSTEELVYFQ